MKQENKILFWFLENLLPAPEGNLRKVSGESTESTPVFNLLEHDIITATAIQGGFLGFQIGSFLTFLQNPQNMCHNLYIVNQHHAKLTPYMARVLRITMRLPEINRD